MNMSDDDYGGGGGFGLALLLMFLGFAMGIWLCSNAVIDG